MQYFWENDVIYSNFQPRIGTRKINGGAKFSEIKVQKTRIVMFVIVWNLARYKGKTYCVWKCKKMDIKNLIIVALNLRNKTSSQWHKNCHCLEMIHFPSTCTQQYPDGADILIVEFFLWPYISSGHWLYLALVSFINKQLHEDYDLKISLRNDSWCQWHHQVSPYRC